MALELSTVVADVHECIVKNGLPCSYSTLREYLMNRHRSLPCERTLQRAMAQLGLAKCYFSPRGSLFDRGSSIPKDPAERRAKYAKFLQDAACESACDSEQQTAEDSPDDASVPAASCSCASASVEDTRDAQLEEVLSGQSKTRDTITRLEAEKAELLKLAQRSYRLKCEIAELRKQALRDLTKIAAMVYADEDGGDAQ